MAAQALILVAAVVLAGCAVAADRQWLDRHFLPPFFISRRVYVVAAWVARAALAAIAAAMALGAPRMARFLARVPRRRFLVDAARVMAAVALALGASELVLRATFRHSSEEQPASQVPYRRLDQRLGWRFVPDRVEHAQAGGRAVEYRFDASGYRVGRAGAPADPQQPTILFTGESIMAGQALPWDETVPAQVEALLGVQSANLAVHGYGTDQCYLRLQAELPRFVRPVAVVTLFSPGLFDRNLDEDRPHLGPALEWLPAKPRWRLAMIASWVVPYRSEEAIERGIAVTRAVLRATAELARSRGATPLILVPQFLPEDATERQLRRRILDDTALPYVWVGLDARWRVPGDRHPDARSTRAMALAVANRLGGHLAAGR